MNTPGQEAYDPSADPKGRGSLIAACVVGVLAVVALASAWRLHAFWWQ